MDRSISGGDADGMPGLVDHQPQPGSNDQPGRSPVARLFWRLFLLNALIFLAVAAVLVLSPATVSYPIAPPELAVIAVGLVALLVVNAVLLRSNLRSLDGLTALMARVDLLRPGDRLTMRGDGDIAHLIGTFNAMLDRLETERSTSTAWVLSAQEGERQRLARELHDEIGQSLTAVLLGLKHTADRAPDDLRDELRTVGDTIRASLDEVRQIARRLRPGVLDDLGLAAAVTALAREFAETTRIPVVPRLHERLPPLTSAVELAIYRVAQESLTNAARHAHPTRIDLSLTAQPDQVVLRVTDNGRGINGTREGTGIRGMRERALLIGADLTVAPHPAGGTEVRLVVPTPTKRG
jgi:two-component system sensor histidine kinase UhpB